MSDDKTAKKLSRMTNEELLSAIEMGMYPGTGVDDDARVLILRELGKRMGFAYMEIKKVER